MEITICSVTVDSYVFDVKIIKCDSVVSEILVLNNQRNPLSRFVCIKNDEGDSCMLETLRAPSESCDTVRFVETGEHATLPPKGKLDILMKLAKTLARDIFGKTTMRLEDCAVYDIAGEYMLLSLLKMLAGSTPTYYKYGFRSELFRNDDDVKKWQQHIDIIRVDYPEPYENTRTLLFDLIKAGNFDPVFDIWAQVIPLGGNNNIWSCNLVGHAH